MPIEQGEKAAAKAAPKEEWILRSVYVTREVDNQLRTMALEAGTNSTVLLGRIIEQSVHGK